MNLYYSYLKNCFTSAIEKGYKYVGLLIKMPNTSTPEIIIVQRENFDSKLEYIKDTYNNDLKHRSNDEIAIIGFTYDNTFDGIEEQLIEGKCCVCR